MTILYRKAVPNDALAIAQLAVEGWRLAYSEIVPASYIAALTVERKAERWREKLAQSSFRAMLAVDGDDLVGFVACGPGRANDETGAGEVYVLYVHPDHQRRGVGAELMRRAESRLAASGFTVWLIWVFTLNEKARRFYDYMGYTVDGASKMETLGDIEREIIRYRKGSI